MNGTRRAGALAFALWAGISGASGCGGASGTGPGGPGEARCEADDIPGCERAIASAVAASAALERPVPRELVATYIEARRDADEADPWVSAYDSLGEAGSSETAWVTVGGPPGAEAPKGTKRIGLAALPRPDAIAEEALWLAIGEEKGLSHVVVDRAGDRPLHLFPRDPLAPFMAGLLPVGRGAPGSAAIASSIAISSALREALAHARAFDYVSAAASVDRLRELLATLDSKGRGAAGEADNEAVLRARYGQALLSNNAIALEAPDDEDGDEAEAAAPPTAAAASPSPPRAGDHPYGQLLRVKLATTAADEWKVRREVILAGLPADRREAMEDFFDPPEQCGPPRALPIEGPRDLIFAPRLAGALLHPELAGADPARQLALPEWIEAYGRVVAAVDRTGTTWAYASSILYERGEQRGLSPRTTDVYRRVTALAKRHIAALEALEKSSPARFASFSLLSLVYARGVLTDDELRDAVVELTQATVRDKMAHAADARGVAEALFTGVLSGMSYPPAIQSAHYLALQGAFTAKLRGDLRQTTGWGVAGLFAADAAFRLISDQAPNLPATAEDIRRSLGEPNIELPALAALATAGTRYAVLGAEGNLSAQVLDGGTGAGVRPDRVEAHRAIKAALENLGAPGEASPALLGQVADLADGMVAATVVALRESPPENADQCATDQRWQPPQNVRRALDKLADKRNAILRSAAYREGDGLWIRRVRLLVTVLSDALDVARRGEGPAKFAIADTVAVDHVRGGLAEWDEAAAIDAIGGGYGLARRLLSVDDPEVFVAGSGQGARELLTGLAKLLHEGDETSGLGGATVLEALRKDAFASDAAKTSLPDTFFGYARAFYEADQTDQGDLMLMLWITMAAILDESELGPAVALVDKHQSRLKWAVLLGQARSRMKKGQDAAAALTAAARPMKDVSAKACADLSVDRILAIAGAVNDFSNGRRDDARKQLDEVLARAESEGLNAGALHYNYKEATRTRIFTMNLGLSPTAGLLTNANTFQVGLGMRSEGAPDGSLELGATKPDDPQALADSGKLYVHAAALASVYHFLEGDGVRGASAARRAIEASVRGVKLGKRIIPADPTGDSSLALDARGTLAVAAQLAAEDGRPFLAGDMWTLVRSSFDAAATSEEIDGAIDSSLIGLAGFPEGEAAAGRAERSLALLARELPCVKDKPAVASYERASCRDYPIALSLRIADGLADLPRLQKGGAQDAQCSAMTAVDEFLGARESGSYDPDRFTQAVDALVDSGRAYDAAAMLARQRNPVHCSPSLVSTSRQLGHGGVLGPDLAADVLSAAVNCSIGQIDQKVIDDFVAIDTLTRDLADPTRGFKMLLFAGELALQKNEPRVLSALTSREGFVDRWMKVSAFTGVSALVADHAAALLSGRSPAIQPTARDHRLVCETYPSSELAPLCADLAALRDESKSVEVRAKVARGALQKVHDLVTGAGSSP